MASNSEIRALARRIASLEASRLGAKQPQLAYSTIVGGALQASDATGETLTMIIGEQYDGTTASVVVSGPPPPQTSPPVVESGIGLLTISWDGLWADPATVAPMDFSRVEVHVSDVDDFEPDLETTLKTTFESPRGGKAIVSLPYDETFYVRLVARSLSGKASEPSETRDGVPGKVTTVDVSSISGGSITDFSLAVKKFNTNTHLLY